VNAYARIRREAGFTSQRAVVEALAATGCTISEATYRRREAGAGVDCAGEDLLIAELFSARLGRTVRARHLWGAPQDDDAAAPPTAIEDAPVMTYRCGHPQTAKNTIRERNGATKCRECHRDVDRRYQRAKVRGFPNGRPQLRPVAERFWEKVNKTTGKFYAGTECWEWTGTRTNGYGRFSLEGRGIYAHRFAYEMANGPLPEGLEPDHLCRNTACVRPEHLEAVTHRVNVRRGNAPAATNARRTHCKRGHEFTPENTYRTASGNRLCRICRRAIDRRQYARRCALKTTLGHGRAAGATQTAEKGERRDGPLQGLPGGRPVEHVQGRGRHRGRDGATARPAAGAGDDQPGRAHPVPAAQGQGDGAGG
jgi:hypothetical protein